MYRLNFSWPIGVLGLGCVLVLASGCQVTVTPNQATLEVGNAVVLTAQSTFNLDTSFTWSSDKESVATVSNIGKVLAVSAGQATITATGTSTGKQGSSFITVIPVSIEGENEGAAEGALEGEKEGLEEGAMEGSAEGAVEGEKEGAAEGSAEGAVEGEKEGAAEGSTEGATEGEHLSDFSIVVDGAVVPDTASMPGAVAGAPTRTLAAVMDEHGRSAEFVDNELLIMTDSLPELNDFLTRWGGTLIQTISPSSFGVDLTAIHLVRINTSLGDTSQLAADILSLDPNSRGANRVSSDTGLRLLSAGAREAVLGHSVGVNWVGRGAAIADRTTSEAPSAVPHPYPSGPPQSPDGFNSSSPFYIGNAFDWNFLNAGSTQDIGVTEAWWLLQQTGRIANRVKIGILDMGFAMTGNLDVPSGWEAYSNVPFTEPLGTQNLLGCSGGSSCPYHGTNVLSAAMAVPDNSFGSAGPAGPVGQPVIVFTLYDFFTSMSAIGIAMSHGADIINMSYGCGVPAPLSWSVIPFDLFTVSVSSHALLIAAAGNDHTDVDEEDCFIVCWEDTWWTPCENNGVLCVGGLAQNSKNCAGDSNYGAEEVDIFAPFTILVGADPTIPIPEPGTFATPINGTSFSSPYTAGVAGLIWAANPALSRIDVGSILISTAQASPDAKVSRYVDAEAAVNQALGTLIHILTPTDGLSESRGNNINFSAYVHNFGHTGAGTVTWSSNVDGTLGTGLSIDLDNLSFGPHTITARVDFSDAFWTTDTIGITITNEPPVINIIAPATSGPFRTGSPITLSSSNYDPEHPARSFTGRQPDFLVCG